MLWRSFLGSSKGRRAAPPSLEGRLQWYERELHERLMIIAKDQATPVLVYQDDDPRMFHEGVACAGLYIIGATLRHIRIARSYMFCPWVLAHELGHHLLYKQGKWPHTEVEADAVSCDLIERLLDDERRQLLRPYIESRRVRHKPATQHGV